MCGGRRSVVVVVVGVEVGPGVRGWGVCEVSLEKKLIKRESPGVWGST